MVLEKIFKKFQCIFTLPLLSPLGEGLSIPLLLYKLEFPSPKDDFCQVWLKLVQWFWRSQKCKSLETDGQTDGRTPDYGRSSLELSAQVS
jgi:hypothetical protein